MPAAKLTKTDKPGYYRRHARDCKNLDHASKCKCAWVIHVYHRGQQRLESYGTYGEAKEAKGKANAGDTKPKSKATFGDYYSDWIETYSGRTKRGFEEETRAEYRRAIEADALPVWRRERMADLGPGDVRALYSRMVKAGKSAAAMRKIKAALSPLFNTAIEDEVVPINIISGVRIPSQPKDPAPTGEDEDEDRGKALTRGELARFLAAVEEQPAKAKRRKSEAEQVGGFDWSVFFGFLAVTGLRIGEAVGLRWEHLDLGGKGGTVKVREQVYEGKRKRYLKSEAGKREIPLTPEWTKRLLEHRRDHYRGPKTPVFASVTGTELRPSNVYRRYLAPAAIDAGLFVEVEDDEGKTRKKTAIAFHAFRHTCASLLFAEGRNVKQVQEWLGHTDPAFTLKVYIHLLDDGLGEGINLPSVVPHLDPDLDPSERSVA